MNREAVLLAREIMEAVPEERVDMGIFFCGTQACLLGHMALSRRFPGLEIEPNGYLPVHTHDRLSGFAAGGYVLGLDSDQANCLFDLATPQECKAYKNNHKAIALARLYALLESEAP